MSRDHTRRLFEFDSVSIHLIYTVAPIDITEGLVLDESYISIKWEGSDTKYTEGLGGEVHISHVPSNAAILDLVYLPSSKNVINLDNVNKTRIPFGIVVQNNSSPRYYGVATRCRILNRPDISIERSGFSNSRWAIVMADYIEKYLQV